VEIGLIRSICGQKQKNLRELCENLRDFAVKKQLI